MASADMSVKIAVETAVFNAMAEVAQRVFDSHGIRINAVTYDWLDVTQIGADGRGFRVSEVRADMTAYPMPEPATKGA